VPEGLPEEGQVKLCLDGLDPNSGADRIDTGERRRRQLRHRTADDVRALPCPPEVTAILLTR
jgi:hypothetical protein